MKLHKLGLSRSSSDADFITLDLTKNSAKAVCLTKSDNNLIVKGVSLLSLHDEEIDSGFVGNVIKECSKQANSETLKILLGLSGGNVLGFLLIAKSDRENPNKKISEKEVGDIFTKIQEAAYEQVKRRWVTFFADDAEFEPLDIVVTTTQVDDRKVEDPIGLTGKSIVVTVFCSYAEKKYYAWATKMVKKVKGELMAVTTCLYSQSKLITEEKPNYIIVDIGGNSTDVGIVFGKNLVLTKSFDMGGFFFTRHLANSLGVDFKHANGKKEAFSLNVGGDDENKIGNPLYEAGRDWVLAFGAVLSSMTGIKSFPGTIYLSGGGAELYILYELLLDKDWHKDIPFAGEIDVLSPKSNLWDKYVLDKLNLLSNLQMFVPASLSVVRLELG